MIEQKAQTHIRVAKERKSSMCSWDKKGKYCEIVQTHRKRIRRITMVCAREFLQIKYEFHLASNSGSKNNTERHIYTYVAGQIDCSLAMFHI